MQGTANIVMWSKVDGAYYFSRVPELQKVENKTDLSFKIPFNAADKTVTEVLLEVELLKGGRVTISGFDVSNH